MDAVDDWRAPDGGTMTKLPDGTDRTLEDMGVQAGACALHFNLEHIKAKAASAQSLDNMLGGLFLSFLMSPVLVWLLDCFAD